MSITRMRLKPVSRDVLAYWAYLSGSYYLLLFHKRYVAGAGRILRLVGAQQYVDDNQLEPCAVSHPGLGCVANALQLSVQFWRHIFLYVCANSIGWSLLLRRRLPQWHVFVWRQFVYTTFLYGSCAGPGIAFCVAKHFSRDRRGTVTGLLLSTAMGSSSLLLLRSRQRRALLLRAYATAVVSWLLLSYRRRRRLCNDQH